MAKHDKVVLLDSDRILPKNYFWDRANELSRGEFVAPIRHFNVYRGYTDVELEAGEIEKFEDFRSTTNECRRKNLFSGNTMFYKEDYLAAGGFDESFVGYGFADTDMTRTIEKAGCTPVFTEDEEVHLYHIKETYHETTLDRRQFKIHSATNALRYAAKWQVTDPAIDKLLHEVENDMEAFTPKDIEAYKSLRGSYHSSRKPII